MKVLDHSAFDLKSSIHLAFDKVWKELVVLNMEDNTLVIQNSLEGKRLYRLPTFMDSANRLNRRGHGPCRGGCRTSSLQRSG